MGIFQEDAMSVLLVIVIPLICIMIGLTFYYIAFRLESGCWDDQNVDKEVDKYDTTDRYE